MAGKPGYSKSLLFCLVSDYISQDQTGLRIMPPKYQSRDRCQGKQVSTLKMSQHRIFKVPGPVPIQVPAELDTSALPQLRNVLLPLLLLLLLLLQKVNDSSLNLHFFKFFLNCLLHVSSTKSTVTLPHQINYSVSCLHLCNQIALQ